MLWERWLKKSNEQQNKVKKRLSNSWCCLPSSVQQDRGCDAILAEGVADLLIARTAVAKNKSSRKWSVAVYPRRPKNYLTLYIANGKQFAIQDATHKKKTNKKTTTTTTTPPQIVMFCCLSWMSWLCFIQLLQTALWIDRQS